MSANAIGDSFLHKCYSEPIFFQSINDVYTALFYWTEPYPLFLLLLIVLIILPAIFKFCSQGSFLKIYRLYNIIRLGLLSLLHQVTYSYTIQTPLCVFVHQTGPCIYGDSLETSISDFRYPFSAAISACVFLFTVARFSGIARWKSAIFITIFLVILVITVIASGLASVFQTVSTIFIAYILHFIHLYIHFKWIHVENAIVLVLNIAATIFCVYSLEASGNSITYLMLFPFSVLLIDEFMITRHQLSRDRFTVERPADLTWSIESQHTESIRLLNNEEEENFDKNLNTDILTAILAFAMFFVIVLVRGVITSTNFFTSPG